MITKKTLFARLLVIMTHTLYTHLDLQMFLCLHKFNCIDNHYPNTITYKKRLKRFRSVLNRIVLQRH